MKTPTLDCHVSVDPEALCREAIESLRANRIDPKFLYTTARQADLWRQVFQQHSPLHGNPEFVRIYRDAFKRVGEVDAPAKILLVGLGCGTGSKELELLTSLQARGCECLFAAIDVSGDLVAESAAKLIAAGARHERSLVCDLAQTAHVKDWLAGLEPSLPRLITFFGLVPNFGPSTVTRIFRAVLRPDDRLLVSAHLAPVHEKGDGLPEAMARILPQYDNPETLAWLGAALENWKLEDRVELPKMEIGQVENIPALVASARWRSAAPFERWGCHFAPRADQPLRLFSSLRYTPALFERFLAGEGFRVERLAMTACREEAIWSIRL